MIRARFLAAGVLPSLLAACGSSSSEALLETVRATEQAQFEAIEANDLRGAVRVYADGAVLVVPGSAPVSGGEDIVVVFEGLLADPNFAIEMTPGPAWAAGSGDLAATTFTARYTSTDPVSGEAVTVPIGNQTVWRKVDGSPWQIVSDYNVLLAVEE